MDALLIVASGKSSRFGGFPKAFCQIGNQTNVDNTIRQAKKYVDKVYIGVNQNTYEQFRDKIKNCEMFSIVTGQGDAHSMLKCFMYMKERDPNLNRVMVCWGDAVFIDDQPFKDFIAKVGEAKVAVACSMDKKPYAWFETTDEKGVLRSHFAKEEGFIECGIHDQSLFMFKLDFATKYLDEYREFLNIPFDNDEKNSDKNEMKLLYFFEYLYKKGYEQAQCVEITPGRVLSFNTQNELEAIKNKIKL